MKKLPYYFEQLEDKEQQKTFLEGFIQETQLMKYPRLSMHPLSLTSLTRSRKKKNKTQTKRTLRHPNVIQLFASFTHPEVMIVMEFMAKGYAHPDFISLRNLIHFVNLF